MTSLTKEYQNNQRTKKSQIIKDALKDQVCSRCGGVELLQFMTADGGRSNLFSLAHERKSDKRILEGIADSIIICRRCYGGSSGVGNRRKADVLGMPFGTASGRLRKILLFTFAQELNKDICYRCSKIIDKIDEFTIEHKKPWLQDSKLFWDLNNIAFSHYTCNCMHHGRNKNT